MYLQLQCDSTTTYEIQIDEIFSETVTLAVICKFISVVVCITNPFISILSTTSISYPFYSILLIS